MQRYHTAIAAQKEANNRGLYWGLCVFGGLYYVGSRNELAGMGVVIHKQVTPPKQLTMDPLPQK